MIRACHVVRRRTRALTAGVAAVGGGGAVDQVEVGDDAGLLGGGQHGEVLRAAVGRMERSGGAVAGRVVVAEVVRCVVRCTRGLAAGVGAVRRSVAVDQVEVVDDARLLGNSNHVEMITATMARVERSGGAVAGRVIGAEVGGGVVIWVGKTSARQKIKPRVFHKT